MILGIFAAVLIAFSSGMVVDRLTAPPSDSVQLNGFSKYVEALQVIRQYYVGRDSLTDQQLVDGSIAGLVQSLGDTNHSRYLTKQEYEQLTSQLNGQLVGIGVLLTTTSDGQFQVTRVLPNSPAQAGGIKAGDVITAVDGKSVSGLTFDQLATMIRGNAGTSVTVSVIHEGSTTPVDVKMVRQTVTAPLVDWGMIPGTTIADIALYEFSQGAGDQVARAITGAEQAGATSLILDLRGNPGGLADEARHVASEFLSTGNIYIVEDASGHRTPITVDKSVKATELPMVVLVDHDTASAAEIVAGALQDPKRARIIGLTTIGTGTVLEPFPLSDGSVILLGIEDWLTPNGHRIFGVGITPDQVVSLPAGGQPTDPYDFSSMTSSQIQSSSDAQLLSAIKDLGQ